MGDKIDGLSDKAIKSELAAGNIELWVPNQTDNVGQTLETHDFTVSGQGAPDAVEEGDE
jgi:hypothetical protein